jgi:hypothetical protein
MAKKSWNCEYNREEEFKETIEAETKEEADKLFNKGIDDGTIQPVDAETTHYEITEVK